MGGGSGRRGAETKYMVRLAEFFDEWTGYEVGNCVGSDKWSDVSLRVSDPWADSGKGIVDAVFYDRRGFVYVEWCTPSATKGKKKFDLMELRRKVCRSGRKPVWFATRYSWFEKLWRALEQITECPYDEIRERGLEVDLDDHIVLALEVHYRGRGPSVSKVRVFELRPGWLNRYAELRPGFQEGDPVVVKLPPGWLGVEGEVVEVEEDRDMATIESSNLIIPVGLPFRWLDNLAVIPDPKGA